jgi:23S rRNA (guanine745-N1)-methyltransferase
LADLSPAAGTVLACTNGHRFDVNRRGFASLIAGSRKLIGDSAAMLDAREKFLERGWYAGLRDALSELVATEPAHRVIDIGCGTGYYLRGVLAGLQDAGNAPPAPAASARLGALAVDLSAAAVARTVRSGHALADTATVGLIADVWSPLPIRDAAADVLLNVFAPRNPAEFHRVLVPDGLLAVVVPHPAHLQELRAAGLALEVHGNKTADLIESLESGFVLESRRDLTSVLTLSPDDVAALIGMGPSAHHQGGHATHPFAEGTDVTVAFRLLGFRRSHR